MALMAKPLAQPPTHASLSLPHSLPPPQWLKPSAIPANHSKKLHDRALIVRRSDFSFAATPPSWSPAPATSPAPPVVKKRTRYRREYPGESKGITEELRFVAMRLRNIDGKKYSKNEEDDSSDDNDSMLDQGEERGRSGSEESDGDVGDTWHPTMEGFLNYLVDSQLVFSTVERIVDDSNDVAYAYFRKTGLERSEGLSRDIECFRQKGMVIPEPSNPGVSYSKYLEQLAERSAPLFLCHFYNIYFSHIAGGQVIVQQLSEKLLDGRELEFSKWEGNVQELLRGVREKLNMLGEHWSRDQKNKCLREASKSFRFQGQIVRLIIS
ncbi:putative inactive heme oxygenase 2 [Morus notabilis]|uniref:Putative inactive heme oxygenase 2 n=1 Tax=Morus notabilis TaxID=981085 RepID=W9RIJ1_9ROSA|nr:probable inactive heme oxygenase 2, chloroplastic [Morus notabilis]EXB75605.1 putative inactive heme oxygenase 2 [Morus notabilis]